MRLVILYYVSFIDYVPFVLSLPLTEFGGGPKGLRSSGCAQGFKLLWLWRGEDKLLAGLLCVFRPLVLFVASFSLTLVFSIQLNWVSFDSFPNWFSFDCSCFKIDYLVLY